MLKTKIAVFLNIVGNAERLDTSTQNFNHYNAFEKDTITKFNILFKLVY